MVIFFVERPIFASAIASVMVLAGSICYSLPPVAQFLNITPPQVIVSARYPGASAQVVADTVTTQLEQQINGSAAVTITFDVGYPIDIAAVDVQNRVSQAAPWLSGNRQSSRRDDMEAESKLRVDRQSHVAGWVGRPGGPVEPYQPADCGSSQTPGWRRRRNVPWREKILDASLAQPGQARKARNYSDGRSASDRQAEIGQDGMADRHLNNATLIKMVGGFPCNE